MEPEDPAPLHHLLEPPAGAPAPGVDELQAIVTRVTRVTRARRALMAAGAAGALLVGLGLGYGVLHRSSGHPTVVATSPQASGSTVPLKGAAPGPAGGAAIGSPVPGYRGGNETYLFTRTAGGVTVRGYQVGSGVPAGVMQGVPYCGVMGPEFQAEVSTDRMVATVVWYALPSTTGAIRSARSEIVGVAEGDPTIVATAATGPSVARVRVAFAHGGHDEMAPVRGWVALATRAPWYTGGTAAMPVGTLTALDAAGRTVGTASLDWGVAVLPKPYPTPVPGTVVPPGGAPGPATTVPAPNGSSVPGSTGSGTAGSGSVSSGRVSGVPASGGGSASGGSIVYPCPAQPAAPDNGASG